MRDRCMLNLTKEQVDLVGEYCSSHSSPLPHSVQAQLTLTDKLSSDESVMAPSPSQCAWLMSFARALRPKRILELGTFTGISTLAFYEGTRKAASQIISLDLSEEYLQIAEEAFRRYGADDRIQTLKGPCLELLPTLRGQFDLIYIDAAEEEYKGYTQFILDNELLSPDGVLLVDDVLLEGLVVDREIIKNFPQEIQQPYLEIADGMNAFNGHPILDERVEVTMIPLFNGVTQIMWK
ncbi:S-adenosyl-L-methionine-dependent methyltransferase [Aspergillus desertorum]